MAAIGCSKNPGYELLKILRTPQDDTRVTRPASMGKGRRKVHLSRGCIRMMAIRILNVQNARC